jgi:hypothetical protein
VQKLLDEEFPGIKHVHTSTLHKAVSSAHHDFVRLTGTENKLEALLQASFIPMCVIHELIWFEVLLKSLMNEEIQKY